MKKKIYCLTQEEFDKVKDVVVDDVDNSAIISIIDYHDPDLDLELNCQEVIDNKDKHVEIEEEVDEIKKLLERKPQVHPVKQDKQKHPNIITTEFDNITSDVDQYCLFKFWKIKKRALTVYEARRLVEFINENIGKDFYIICDDKAKSNPFKEFISQFYNWVYGDEKLEKSQVVNQTILYKLKDAYRERTGEYFILDYYISQMAEMYATRKKGLKLIAKKKKVKKIKDKNKEIFSRLFGEWSMKMEENINNSPSQNP